MKKYLLRQKGLLSLILFCALISSACVTASPLLLNDIIDRYGKADQTYVIVVSVIFSACIIGLLVFEYFKKVLIAKIGMRIKIDVRRDFFARFEAMDYLSFHSKDKDYYSSMMVTDLDGFYKDYYENIIYGIVRVVEFLAYGTALFFVNWPMALILIVSSFISLFVPGMVGGKLDKRKAEVSERNAAYLHDLTQLLSGHDYCNSATREKLASEHEKSSTQREGTLFRYNRYYAFVEIFGALSLYLVDVIVFVSGLVLVYFNLLTLGGFVASMVFCDLFAAPFGDFIYIMIGVRSSKPYLEKFVSYLDRPSFAPASLYKVKKNISLSNVVFQNRSFTLGPVNLEFRLGKKYAIIGSNGSGKTTLLKLLLGFLKPKSGEIQVDGKPIENLDVSSFAAYIDQNVFMFDDTVENNISLFGSYGLNGVKDTLAKMDFDVPLDRRVGDFGSAISGGERSKIALARATNQGKECLLLDESFSAIDEASKKEIQDFLFGSAYTIVSVTHDISKEHLKRFDAIVVMENGLAKEYETSEYFS